MTEIVIETESDRTAALLFVEKQPLPCVVSVVQGKHRTVSQNRLQRLWLNEVAAHTGDTAEEVRGYCKLTIGVPLLRAANETFREKYDRLLKPLTYAEKLEIMMEPLDLPVTRIMTSKQKTEYLDQLYRHFTEQGIALTRPDWPDQDRADVLSVGGNVHGPHC